MEIPKQRAAKNVNETVFKIFKKLIREKENLRILNIACGEGYLEYLILREYGEEFFIKNEWYAVDIDIEQFKLKHLPIKLIQYNANEKLPFPDELFDIVISVETIEHLKRPVDFLEELARVLKKNGYLILTTPNVLHIYDRILFLFKGELWYFHSPYKEGGHLFPIFTYLIETFIKKYGLVLRARYSNNLYNPMYRGNSKVSFKLKLISWFFKPLFILIIKTNNKSNIKDLFFDINIFVFQKQ